MKPITLYANLNFNKINKLIKINYIIEPDTVTTAYKASFEEAWAKSLRPVLRNCDWEYRGKVSVQEYGWTKQIISTGSFISALYSMWHPMKTHPSLLLPEGKEQKKQNKPCSQQRHWILNGLQTFSAYQRTQITNLILFPNETYKNVSWLTISTWQCLLAYSF